MIKQILRTTGLLVFTVGMLVAAPAFAAATITGSVYSITPTDVYIEMADHTAVRVPNDSASFLMNGAPVDITDLRQGNQVMVEYGPKTTVQTTTRYDSVGKVPHGPSGTVSVTRDTTVDGHVVHHYWSDGSWHVRQ